MVIDVCLCSECKRRGNWGANEKARCNFWKMFVGRDDYCSHGLRYYEGTLDKCPLCGSEGEFTRYGQWYGVRCRNVECEFSKSVRYAMKPDGAVTAWKNRIQNLMENSNDG